LPCDIKTQEDLKLLPIITKEMLREAIKRGELFQNNISHKKLIYNSSSGSTGEPFQFYESRLSESIKKASALRGWYWMGYRLGDKFIKISQLPRSSILKKIQDIFSRSLFLHISNLDDQSFKLIFDEMKSYEPTFLRIYPDHLGFLTSYMRRKNIRMNCIKAINTTGSILTKQVRESAEEIFDCKIFDGFSCEGGAVVFECPTHECYHSAMEYAITEILDENGNDTPKGKLITTDLWNFITPFIRYDTQDIIEINDCPCYCGRKLQSIKTILGRESDILVTPSGRYLIVNNFTGHFQWIKEIEHFQIHQTQINIFDVYLKVSPEYNSVTESKIVDLLKKAIKDNVEINIKLVDNIPISKSGKRKFLIRNKEIKLPSYASE